MEQQWHHLDIGQIYERLKTSDRGLSSEEAASRLAKHGPNELLEKKKTPPWVRFLRQFKSPIIYVLLAAAVIALGLGEFSDAGVILGVLFINATIGFIHEGRAERAVAALRKMTTPFATLRRDGKETVVPARDVVPGDILLVHAGDRLAADARIIESAALEVLESSLTGESTAVSKRNVRLAADVPLADRKNMLYKGTIAVAGRATSVVVATGMATELGRIAHMVQEAKEPPTPLQARLEQLGRVIIVTVLALIVVIVGLGRLRKLEWRKIFMVVVSQAVAAIPESMPVALTIALAVGMQRMARRKAIIRRLAAVETLGGVTVVCSDKTGTLTKNEMTVTQLWTPEEQLKVSGIGYEPKGKFRNVDGAEVEVAPPSAAFDLLRCAALCNDSTLVPPQKEDEAWSITGDPTEGALVVVAAKAGIDIQELRKNNPRVWEIPFDAVSRLMATGHITKNGTESFSLASNNSIPPPQADNAGHAPTGKPESPRICRIYVKGAAEAVLGFCANYRRGGETWRVDEAFLTAVAEAQRDMANNALRVLGFAYTDLEADRLEEKIHSLRGRLTFLGMTGALDPPRPEVREAISLCKQAGVRTVMVTGDHLGTGKAIGDELGIGPKDSKAIDGTELAKMTSHQLDETIDQISVFARIAPEQKVRIVDTFQRKGEVVAMTGDGVNDAPALMEADIGVAMGITGTEVTKEAAAMVITDDNFVTIAGAIEEGRVIYNNVRKTIFFLLSTSTAGMVTLLSALAAGLALPLRAAQILWVNLITDGALSINLIMEKREGTEMARPPIPRDEPLISLPMLMRMLLLVPIMGFGTVALFAWKLANGYPQAHAQTAAFTLLAVYQWCNVLNCRSDSRSLFSIGLRSNPFVLIGLTAGVLLQLVAIYVPFMQGLMGTVPLGIYDWLRILALASIVIWADEIFKWYGRRARATRRQTGETRGRVAAG